MIHLFFYQSNEICFERMGVRYQDSGCRRDNGGHWKDHYWLDVNDKLWMKVKHVYL